MYKANSLPAIKTISNPHNSNKVPGTNRMVIKKWINIPSSDPRFNNPPKGKTKGNTENNKMLPLLNKIDLQADSLQVKTKQTTTQVLSNKIDLRTASGTVDNSMETDADLLLGIQQSIRITLPPCSEISRKDSDKGQSPDIQSTLPPCAEILEKDSDKDLLPCLDQIIEITLPPCAEILRENNDEVPSINDMLPYDILNDNTHYSENFYHPLDQLFG